MKKTYINPETEVMTIMTSQILAGSIGVSGEEADVDENGDYNSLTRRRSWDEE